MSGTLYSKLAPVAETEAPVDPDPRMPGSGSMPVSQPVSSALPQANAAPVIESSPLVARMFRLLLCAETKTQLIKAIAELSRQLIEPAFFWYIETDQKSGQRALALTSADQTALWNTVSDDVIRLLNQVESPGKVAQTTMHLNASSVLVGTRLQNEAGQPESIVAITPARPEEIRATEEFVAAFALVVQSWTTQYSLRNTTHSVGVYQKLVQLSNILTGVESTDEANVCSVNFVREMLEARQVALAICPKGKSKFRVEAISDIETFDRTTEFCSSIAILAQHACEKGKPVSWHSEGESVDAENLQGEPDAEAQLRTQWQKRFCNLSSCEFASAIPIELRSGDQACLVVAHASQETARENGTILEACCKTIGNQLGLLQKSSRGAVKISLDKTLAFVGKRTGKLLLGSIAAFALLMLIPMPYIVKTDCQLEPVQRRFVDAPFDAVIDRAEVENGDVVVRDQVLAKLDGRELRIELAGLQASLQSEQKKHDASLASRDLAQSQIALLEVKRLEAEIQLIQDKLQNLTIRSPIDGVVVSGDLEKSEGARIEIGQNLFEIAPLDRMLVEIEVAESEVRYAKPGCPVSVLFDAYPYDRFEGTILRIHPRAEIRGDQSIFVAEVELNNSDGQLRPGMKGRCRIRSNWQPLGWSLFHHSYENVRGWLVW